MRNVLTIALLATLIYGCNKKIAPAAATRSYSMGFSSSAPRFTYDALIQSFGIWEKRADAAIISNEVPWDSLIAGEKPEDYIVYNYKWLVDNYRGNHFKLWIYIDPQNSFDRSSDATTLTKLGLSITSLSVQSIYRRYAFCIDSMLKPDHLGLALETNLIRGAAPNAIYQSIRQVVNAAAGDIRSFDQQVKLSVSVQVDFAWNGLSTGPYMGIEQDFTDFPFIQELGLSSYPYFNQLLENIPDNYYSRLLNGRSMPVFVSEGGWPSVNMTGFSGQPIKSSPALQQQYIARQMQLLDNVKAIGVFQLTFTDIDLTGLPPSVPEAIKYFAFLGLVDAYFQPKPALSTWDDHFKRPLVPR